MTQDARHSIERPDRAGARGIGRCLATILVLVVLLPTRAQGQTLFDLLSSIRQGGGWIDVPVARGKATLLTAAVPTAGLGLTGCLRIWWGHSGTWDLRIRDTRGSGSLDRIARPDEPVQFAYATGPVTQLEVEVRWSEPRDTTLVLWVGLGSAPATPARRDSRDPCEPVYGPPPRPR